MQNLDVLKRFEVEGVRISQHDLTIPGAGVESDNRRWDAIVVASFMLYSIDKIELT